MIHNPRSRPYSSPDIVPCSYDKNKRRLSLCGPCITELETGREVPEPFGRRVLPPPKRAGVCHRWREARKKHRKRP